MLPRPVSSADRDRVIAALATRVPDPAALGRPVRVGVDGVDGAGKTVLADELAAALRAAGRTVVRASVDGFHRPRAERYARGRTSPEGFYRDSYDYDALRHHLLQPFGPDGSRRYRTAVRDVATDQPVDVPERTAPDDAVLVVDGLFLHRPGLASTWDFSVFLDVPFETTFARMAVRDGCPADPGDPANTRYRDGQLLYLGEVAPPTARRSWSTTPTRHVRASSAADGTTASDARARRTPLPAPIPSRSSPAGAQPAGRVNIC